MAKVYSPNTKYDGITAGVQFSNGVGETDDKYILGYLSSKGYKVEENKGHAVDTELEELKKEATALNITFKSNIGKEKLKERIEEVKKMSIPGKENKNNESLEKNDTGENSEEDELEDFFEDPNQNE